MACPFGDLSRRHSPVRPCGQAGVTKVVRSAGQRGAVTLGSQGRLASPVPGAPVGDRRYRPTLDAPEERAICGAAEPIEMLTLERDQGGWARDRPAFALGPVLQAAVVSVGAIVGPLLPCVRAG